MEDRTTNNFDLLIKNLLGKFNTLLDCPARFRGCYGGQSIQRFIEYIKSYKRVKCISDEQALQELGYLLTEHAHLWWLRRKCHFTTWSEALTALQNQYVKQRPAYLIYKDLFEHKFEDYTAEEDFIDDKYELLTELPDPMQSEKNKLDMIFALLPHSIQSKLEYANIINVAELKEQILKSKNRQCSKVMDSKEKECTSNAPQYPINGKRKNNFDEQHGIMATSALNHVETLCLPSTSTILNDKDPVIKVRRTEDLMPPIKVEASDDTNVEHQEEFISTATVLPGGTRENPNFQIDMDIMNQINNIIDESELNCDSLCDTTVQISSIMSIKDSPTTTIGFLLNGETTIQAEVSKKPHPAVCADATSTRKRKLRCSYCRSYGHGFQNCMKRLKHIELKLLQKSQEPQEAQNCMKRLKHSELKLLLKSQEPQEDTSKDKDSKRGDDTVTIVNITNDNDNSNASTNDVSNASTNASITTTSTASPLVHHNAFATVTTTAQQNMVTCVTTSTPTVSHSISIGQVSTTFSHQHITTTATSSNPSSPAAALTTKLIAPINGPCPSKQMAAKFRNLNQPSPKCHQCGTVGFYKSICPNCSPIYNSQKL
ncbi:uncharacterized protein LOC106081992 [Stomoxys calcitrans]|uniref:uncharacterized protein LOC106081992 n=1 Tax=Stomoxys calcitrans TaxID=35570 RepID=UPI0027E26047|nr:uncharacterized protein LOC106081992 [Stomoxys calcitrans]XP_013099736.2 uncharacterized protein LOC106081992 [Stomoxys calcitrans]XP_013099737.2 uncharacterized protein LOC106081992 [Stomoxys calcitrans]XP_059222617.1 uncharacterized protein LOC106081992 [Stomoxys calcitrans]